jgi:nitrite reductase (NAD(P)H)
VKGVFVYRSIADLDAIISYAEEEGIRGGHATVVGGGLLGLEAVSRSQLPPRENWNLT